MKKLEDKVKKHEEKAKRTLARRQAVKLGKQATKFRTDAMMAGLTATKLGAKVYNTRHPIYEDLIEPLLKEAATIAAKAGFDILYQTRTPIPDSPNLTVCLGSFSDPNGLTPTMKAQVDLIKARPHMGGDKLDDLNCQSEPAE